MPKSSVALSGGADSALLIRTQQVIMRSRTVISTAAGAEESDRDELFVRQLCKRTGIHLHTIDFNTTQYAKENRFSIEMAAREACA